MSSSIKRPVDDSGDTSYDRFALLSKKFRGLKGKGVLRIISFMPHNNI